MVNLDWLTTTPGLYLLNIVLYSVLPLYLTSITPRLRKSAFYVYISIVLLAGGLVGTIYSFSFTENLNVSGGNIAYGAFMMSSVMLIIIEHDERTFWNLIRLVVMVNVFVFFGFNFLAFLLESNRVLNPLLVPASLFRVSLWVLILGGTLILGEILILLFVFLQVRKYVTDISALTVLYTLSFILILCLDGMLFPLFALGLDPNLVSIIFGNVTGKAIVALSYSIPMAGFYIMSQRSFAEFLNAPLSLSDYISLPREKLLDALYYYEMREQQLERDKQELTEIASRDELTTLANRRKFEQVLDFEWMQCRQNGYPLTVVIGDVDFFKQYNDSYGHPKGDECLRKIASIWKGISTRRSDLAARLGGEEFAFILPNTHPTEILPNLQNFVEILRKKPIPHRTSSVAPHVTLSIGVAGCIPHKDSSPQKLLSMADRRLYAAKRGGRNRVVIE